MRIGVLGTGVVGTTLATAFVGVGHEVRLGSRTADNAALLALSVQGHTNAVIPRERVIQSYRVYINAHPESSGAVAPDLAAWQVWDAVPEYQALMKSSVRQQYPSMLAMLAYLRQSPGGSTAGTAAQGSLPAALAPTTVRAP